MSTPRGPLNSTVPPNSTVVGAVYNSQPPAPLDGQPVALQTDANGNLKVINEGGGVASIVQIEDSSGNVLNSNGSGALNVAVVSGGGSNPSVGLTGAAAPTSATEIGIIDGTGKLQGVSSTNPAPVTVTTALPAGTNVIGHVITDTGSTTAVTGNVTVVQPTGSNLHVVNDASSAVIGHVIADTGSTTVVTGNVTVVQPTGTNLHAVIDAGTAVIGHVITDTGSVTNATLSAETTKVIGTVNQGTSPWVVSGAVTSSGTATVVGTLTNNNAAPAATNVGALTALANAANPTFTEGDQTLVSVDLHGGQRVIDGNIPEITATWNNGTALNTALTMTVTGYATVTVAVNTTGSFTGGQFTFEVSDANTNWYPILGEPIDFAGNNEPFATRPFLGASNNGYRVAVTGWVGFRVRLSTGITGTGTVNIGIQASSMTAEVGIAHVFTTPETGSITTVTGALANNSFPVSANLGVMPALASAAAPIWTEGNQVLLSEDLAGNLRVKLSAGAATIGAVTGTLTNNNAAPAANNLGVLPAIAETAYSTITYTTGNQVLPVTDLHGASNVDLQAYAGTALGAPTNFGTTPGAVVAGSANSSTFIGTVAAVAASAGVQKVGISGGTGATIDSTVASGTAPTNAIAVEGIYNTTEPAPTNGQATAVQQDQAANLLQFPGVQFKAGTAWTSATTINTLQYPTGTATPGALFGAPAVLVQLNCTSTQTTGAVTFQGTYDNINWVTIPVAQVLNPNTFAQLTNPFTFTVANTPFLILTQGYSYIRANLTTVIGGTGSVTPEWATLSYTPIKSVTVQGQVAADSAFTGNPVAIAGVDGSGNVQELPVADTSSTAPSQAVVIGGVYNTTTPAPATGQAVQHQTDSTGSAYVNTEGRKTTYRAAISAFAPIASATAPSISLTGSASKTVRIIKISYSGTAATGSAADIVVQRLSALSGGTSAAIAVAKMDTNNAAATASPLSWSAAATTATSAGVIAATRYEIVTAAVAVQPELVTLTFGDTTGQAFVLRGISDFMALRFSAIGTTPVFNIWIEWTEE